jgi:hypothetical protein
MTWQGTRTTSCRQARRDLVMSGCAYYNCQNKYIQPVGRRALPEMRRDSTSEVGKKQQSIQ